MLKIIFLILGGYYKCNKFDGLSKDDKDKT